MDSITSIFYLFSAVILLSALRVVTAKNPVHAALFLVLAFFSTAASWMLIKAEFLAIALILIYVGAVMVLFLFVVMMLNDHVVDLRKGFWYNLPLAAFVAAVMALELGLVLSNQSANLPSALLANTTNDLGFVAPLGKLLYTKYLYPFELAGVLLMIAAIAAVTLTLRKRKDTKYIDPAVQIAIDKTQRIRIVKMASEPKEVTTEGQTDA